MLLLVRKLFIGPTLLFSLAIVVTPALMAQDDGPPNVLVIHREYLKPGKGGMIHQRSESAFVHAFADAKTNYPYFALDSLSGPTRSLFMFSYSSFADWEKETSAIRGNQELAAKVDQASLADGDLLSNYDASALALRPDLSLNKGSIKGTRFFEITLFVVKPGHTHDFTELAHMYKDTYSKIAPEMHWDCFELMYGNPAAGIAGGNVFLVINTMKSLSETDEGLKASDKFGAALGAGGMQKIGELSAASIESESTNLFAVNPKLSNPRSEWVKNEPDFWKVP